MIIVDGHLDLALNALQNNRDLMLDAYTTRALESNTVGKGKAKGTVALPDMRRGRVALCFTTLCARCTGHTAPHIDFGSPMQAYGVAQGQLAYYRALERERHVRVVTNCQQLDSHIEQWQRWDSQSDTDSASPPLGLVVSMESADPILAPNQLEEWWASGLRLIGPAHFGVGRYAGGTGCNIGLRELAPALLSEMERLRIPLDTTHLSDESFWQALDHFGGRVLASHTNSRKLVPHQREFDDAQLRAILERDGVIGVTLGNWQLLQGWIVGAKNEHLHVTLDRAVDHIDHICQLAGDNEHVAIGSDLDGGVGTDEFPADLDTIADLQRFEERLSKRGYSGEAIADILHQNWIDFLRMSWSA
ncbi:MAG: peptidase M19 [Planctomycetaceae bacterium]|nr:peptidase M19 [Planctomycetaceae bacterium]